MQANLPSRHEKLSLEVAGNRRTGQFSDVKDDDVLRQVPSSFKVNLLKGKMCFSIAKQVILLFPKTNRNRKSYHNR